jgi:GntR family carbon starvation induced transcriptional regulator
VIQVSVRQKTLQAGEDERPVAADEPAATLAETAYQRLHQDILTGVFTPGQPLRLELLKQRYGLSFSPLREALNRLASERLVIAAALRGFSVAPFSIDEMWDATETRILVECEALRRSMKNGNDNWEARIVAAFHALELQARRIKANARDASDEEVALLESRHQEFHRALIAGCTSPRLVGLADQLYAETQRYRLPSLIGRFTPKARDIADEHRSIMQAALKRASAEAVDLLSAHYRKTAETIEAALIGK